MSSGAKIAKAKLRTYRVVFNKLEEFRGGTSEWMIVQVQAKMVVKQAHSISHVERVFPSSCQPTRDVEFEAEDCPGRTKKRRSRVIMSSQNGRKRAVELSALIVEICRREPKLIQESGGMNEGLFRCFLQPRQVTELIRLDSSFLATTQFISAIIHNIDVPIYNFLRSTTEA